MINTYKGRLDSRHGDDYEELSSYTQAKTCIPIILLGMSDVTIALSTLKISKVRKTYV